MLNGKLGIHCQPDAVVSSPEYARQLVEEAGVDTLILRTGYSLDIPAALGEAVQIARDLGAQVSFLMGSWWGGSIHDTGALPSKSWESKYPMDMPGSAFDTGVIDKLKTLCSAYKPDAICMTHTRYRHPGYVEGVLDEGRDDPDYLARMQAAGIPRSAIQSARAAWEAAMGACDKAALLKASEQGLASFLCQLAQDDAFSRLLSFRRETVHSALLTFRQTVKAFGVSFGSNVYAPMAANLCGQDYDGAYAQACDFVQPLLPFMEYHRFEPIAAWARYILQHARVDEPTAIAVALNLFGLDSVMCPNSLQELDTCAEGSDAMILSMVGRELDTVKRLSDAQQLQPVLRGKEWGYEVTDALIARAGDLGYRAFAFMGCDYLLKGIQPKSANYQYVLTDPSPGDGWF